MAEKIKRKDGSVNPFIDPDGYRSFVERAEKTFQELVAAEKAGR